MGNVARTWSMFCAMRQRARGRNMLVTILLIGIVLPGIGCVRRRLNVRTNPPGAVLYVDNQQIGTTPCSVDFTYYGTREIRLVKPGYETLTVNQPIPTPWYEFPPLDFISENLVATKIRDNRTVTYDLAPQVIVPTQQLVDRANQLRQDALQYPVTTTGATVPAVPGAVVPAAPIIAPGPLPAPSAAPPGEIPQRLPDVFPPPIQPMAPGSTPGLSPAPPGAM